MSITPVGGASAHVPAPVAPPSKPVAPQGPGATDSDGDSDHSSAGSSAAKGPGTVNVKA